MRPPRSLKLATLAAALAALALGAAIAHAELAQNGKVRIAFHGGISPQRLPRRAKAPISVLLGAKITTTDRSTPPKLGRIALALNSHGAMDTAGLPTCPLAKLKTSSAAGALRACRKAQVGRGYVISRIALPGQAPIVSNGPLLAFNGRYKHRTAIFAQVTAQDTGLPLTYVIVFRVKRTHGAYGTELDAKIPPIASGYGYISIFELTLKRQFHYRRHRRSYLSANCPVPKGIGEASFSFARSTYSFVDGRKINVALTRVCKAR